MHACAIFEKLHRNVHEIPFFAPRRHPMQLQKAEEQICVNDSQGMTQIALVCSTFGKVLAIAQHCFLVAKACSQIQTNVQLKLHFSMTTKDNTLEHAILPISIIPAAFSIVGESCI